MNKSLEDKLLNTILSKTKDGSLTWSISQSIFNSETHNYKCNLNSETIIKIEINLNENLLFNHSGSIWVENSSLTNGRLLILKIVVIKLKKCKKEVFPNLSVKFESKLKSQDSILGELSTPFL